jgi:YHS domain-containing protein
MNRNIRTIALMAALAVVVAIGLAAQQQSADKAVDPVCGMTVVKANAKATFDYKGTTYYFCSTGCKDAFAKEPEKYLKAQQAAAEKPAAGQMSHMGAMGQGQMMGQMGQGQMGQGQMGMMQHQPMANCPMMGQGMMMRGMRGRMGRMGMMARRPMMAAPGLAQLLHLYGDKIEVTVENTKDGAALKVTSKDPEVVKAIQVHMAEHIAMMKKMKEAAATAPAAATGIKAPAESACADCPMKKK